jgi:hypothetical protein
MDRILQAVRHRATVESLPHAKSNLSRLNVLLRYWYTLQHVSLKSILLRLRREIVTAYVLRLGMINRNLRPILQEAPELLAKLVEPNFVAAAWRHRAIVSSSFSFDQKREQLIFLRTGDAVGTDFIKNTRWNESSTIATSDIDRCYFAAFGESIILVDLAEPEASLRCIAEFLTLLEHNTRPEGRSLTIPWQPYSCARRLCNVLFGLSLLLSESPRLSELDIFQEVMGAARKLDQLLRMLREDDLGYNHLASEIFAQCIAAQVFHDADTLEYRLREFVVSMRKQVGGDGGHLERSATYHAQVLAHVDVLATANSFGSEMNSTLQNLRNRMCDALAVLTHRDGDIVLFNDSAIGDGPSPQILDAEITRHERLVQALPDCGFYRLNGGAFSVICDIGSCGPDELPAHSHADFLSIEASFSRQRFISDPGVATTMAGRERTWTRSSQTHNGPTFRGLEPIDFWSAFRVGYRGYAYRLDDRELQGYAPLWMAGWQDGFLREGGKVGRWVGLWPDQRVATVDVWLGCEGYEAVSTFSIWHSLHCEDRGDCHFDLQQGLQIFLSTKPLIGKLNLIRGLQFPFGPRSPKVASCLVGSPAVQGGYRVLATVWNVPSVSLVAEFSPEDAGSAASVMVRCIQGINAW